MDDGRTERFWRKVHKGGDCWLWTGAKSSDGYGRFPVTSKKLVQAHRFSFELAGNTIAPGLVLDHTCRTRNCVNPAHLRAVDRKTNVHENSQALAHINSLKTKCPKGHALEGENLVFDRGKRRCRTCKTEGARKARAERSALRAAAAIALLTGCASQEPPPLKRISEAPLSPVCAAAREQGKTQYVDAQGVTHLCPLRGD